VEAAVKAIGGVDFAYSLRGDGRELSQPVDSGVQRRTLDALMGTLAPAELEVPRGLLPMLSSGWSGNSDRQYDIEIFRTAGGPVFDPMAASEAAAAVTLNALLAPERLNRLAEQSRLGTDAPSPSEIVDRVLSATFAAPSGDAGTAAVQRRIATSTALTLARVQRDPALSPTVALILDDQLHQLAERLGKQKGRGAQPEWSRGLARLLSDKDALTKALAEPARTPRVPPGMPIGGAEGE
jgi:hypothetical protein